MTPGDHLIKGSFHWHFISSHYPVNISDQRPSGVFLSHHRVMFGVHGACRIGDICHVIAHDHVIKQLCDFVVGAPTIISHHSINFGNHRHHGSRNIMYSTRPHMTMWLKGRVTLWLVPPYHKSPSCLKSGGYEPSESGAIVYFIFHVTSCHHIINELYEFVTLLSPDHKAQSSLVVVCCRSWDRTFFHLSRNYLTTWSEC